MGSSNQPTLVWGSRPQTFQGAVASYETVVQKRSEILLLNVGIVGRSGCSFTRAERQELAEYYGPVLRVFHRPVRFRSILWAVSVSPAQRRT